ncbi:hypothetical protein GCM10010376_65660 [Streptomyces violaceusniger]
MRRVPPRSGRPAGPRVGTALDGEAEAAPEQPVSAAEPPSAATAAAAVVRTERRGIPAGAGAAAAGAVRGAAPEVEGDADGGGDADGNGDVDGGMNGSTLRLLVQWNDWVKCVNDNDATRSGQPFFRGN